MRKNRKINLSDLAPADRQARMQELFAQIEAERREAPDGPEPGLEAAGGQVAEKTTA